MGAWWLRFPTGPLATVLAASLLTSASRWAFAVTLSVIAFDRSGATAVGAIAAAQLFPAMAVAPLAGRLVDRGDRGRVVSAACSLRAVCVAGAAALVAVGGSLVPIAALAALGSVAATASRPALQALMPALARSPEDLTHATALWSASDNGGFLLGAGLGGIAIGTLGAGIVAAASAGCVAVAAVLTARLPIVTATALDSEDRESTMTAALAGARAVARSRLLRAPFTVFIGLVLLEGTTDVQLVTLAIGRLRLGNGGPGILFAAWGAGGALAGIVILWCVRRRGYGLAMTAGGVAFAAAVAVSGLDGLVLALVAMIVAGIGFSLVETGVIGLVPRLADDAIVGRVYGLMESIYAGAAGIGALIAPGLIAAFGVSGSLVAVGGAFALLITVTVRAMARIDTGQEQAARIRELLRGIAFLAPLPLPRLERLVQEAQPFRAAAGTVIIRAGDRGDVFFVLEHGEVEIAENRRRQGPGTAFGEIALLQGVPRTTTVDAVTDTELWTISRRLFVAAITAHGDAKALADAIVAEHLARPLTTG
jgi:MFS family permease